MWALPVIIGLYILVYFYEVVTTASVLAVNNKMVRTAKGDNLIREVTVMGETDAVVLSFSPYRFECADGDVVFTVRKLDDRWWQFDMCDGHTLNAYGCDLPDGAEVRLSGDSLKMNGEPCDTLAAVVVGDGSGYVVGGYRVDYDGSPLRSCQELPEGQIGYMEETGQFMIGVGSYGFQFMDDSRFFYVAVPMAVLLVLLHFPKVVERAGLSERYVDLVRVIMVVIVVSMLFTMMMLDA